MKWFLVFCFHVQLNVIKCKIFECGLSICFKLINTRPNLMIAGFVLKKYSCTRKSGKWKEDKNLNIRKKEKIQDVINF